MKKEPLVHQNKKPQRPVSAHRLYRKWSDVLHCHFIHRHARMEILSLSWCWASTDWKGKKISEKLSGGINLSDQMEMVSPDILPCRFIHIHARAILKIFRILIPTRFYWYLFQLSRPILSWEIASKSRKKRFAKKLSGSINLSDHFLRLLMAISQLMMTLFCPSPTHVIKFIAWEFKSCNDFTETVPQWFRVMFTFT